MNINQQQGGPNPGQPWLPQGQGQNYGYRVGPPQVQGVRPGMAMVPPKSSTGPSAMQQVPMFSTQNGNVTPPAPLNPGMNMGTGQPQQPMNQVTLF